ncbi:MAG: glucose-6-phosphate isomerase [Parvularculaceae bacterium]
MIDIATTEEWRRLRGMAGAAPRLRDAFADDPGRATRYALEAAGLFVDFSKNRINDAIFRDLLALARQAGLEDARARMFAGEKINETEDRAVLHVALRDLSGVGYTTDGENASAIAEAERQRMRDFCARVHDGAVRGFAGAPLDTVVNIGIGGSDLGPQMATEALRPFWIEGRRTYFVSNVDGRHLAAALSQVDPGRTLFIVASKTFATQETMTNAASARAWFIEKGGKPGDVARHFAALSTNTQAVGDFGVSPEQTFGFRDWVGGRYSLWSVIGLAIALQAGFENFERLLAGGEAMDAHFREAPLEKNLPALLALIGVWNRNFLNIGSHAVLPYDQHLARLPAYLQQADMESNGKSRRIDGMPVSCATGPVIFGEPGTNGQHAFYQLIHQGTDIVSADFIAAACVDGELGDHHRMLLANFLAQPEALMRGRTEGEAREEMAREARKPADIDRLAPHKVFAGDRPTNTILMERLTPQTLGALIALYEHKIFCQGVIWGINSFDQWGVELGKSLAGSILPEIAPLRSRASPGSAHDASTRQLIDRINAYRTKKP